MVKKTVKRASRSRKPKAAKKTVKKSAKRHAVKKTAVKKTVKKTSKTKKKATNTKTTKRSKSSKSCPKCGHTKFDKGEIKIGQVYNAHNFGYKSENHYPYADHVGQQKAVVCLRCGYTEIYIDVHDLKRKVKR